MPLEKTHLPPVTNMGSKKLLPGNSVLKEISWKNRPIFTEIGHLLVRQTQFHIEICYVINLPMGAKWAVIWPPCLLQGMLVLLLLFILATHYKLNF